MIRRRPNIKSISSYNGWLCHANCINLTRKYIRNEYYKNKKIKLQTAI